MTLKFWQVQASLQGVTPDGWQSSRQLPTMIIGAKEADRAARMVSDMAWDMTPGDYVRKGTRRTVALVAEVSAEGSTLDGHNASWAYISYGWGGIATSLFGTYAELDAYRTQHDGIED